MEINKKDLNATGIKFYIKHEGREVARAHLYLLRNDLHKQPFGFMEDVFISEELRGKGMGTTLVQRVIEEAKTAGCYKLICTSRHSKPKVHALYEKLGFADHGKEFRMNF
ncbi:MAG: GNAT family N-acetyltransferase [archaeon]